MEVGLSDQELSPTGHQPLLHSLEHRQHCRLVQLLNLGCLCLGILFEMSLNGDSDDIFYRVNNLIDLSCFKIGLAIQTKLCREEPGGKLAESVRHLVMVIDWAITSPSHSSRGHWP